MKNNYCSFTEDKTIKKYAEVIFPNVTLLDEISKFLFDNIKDFSKILDVGCGKGDFSLPLLKFVNKNRIPFKYDGFDTSEKMIQSYEKRLFEYPFLKDSIDLSIADAEIKLPYLGQKSSSKYSLAFLSFVLHYFRNWEFILNSIYQLLKPKSALVQVAAFGYFSLFTGERRCLLETPVEHVEFWKNLFTKKHEISNNAKWDKSIDTISLENVRKYLELELGMKLRNSKVFVWKRKLSFQTLLDWIISSPISSISGNLTPGERNLLKNWMKNWLSTRRFSLSKKYEVPFAWRVFIHEK